MSKQRPIKVAVTSPTFSKNADLVDELNQSFEFCTLNTEGKRFSQSELVDFIGGSDGAIVGLEKINREVLDACPNLKMISKYGVGLDNIDLRGCRERGIQIGWTGGVNRVAVAELTVGFMLALVRNTFICGQELKRGVWNKLVGRQLSEMTIGIIGLGNVGKEVVRFLRPFNCDILVNDIIDQSSYCEEEGLIIASKDELYKKSDIISLHVPLGESTYGLINYDVLCCMKREAFLINTSRGEIVHESALKQALQDGSIAGAAIDVFETEPPEDLDLLKLPNLICTPHIGGSSIEAITAMGRSAIQHLKEHFDI